MLTCFLVAQLAASATPVAGRYSTPALQAFVAEAARANRIPPPSLRGYRAKIESELSLLLRDTLARETVAQVEQVAMTAAWKRNESYDLRVVGYRSQTVGVPYSAMSFARSWTLPYLYGDRLLLGVDVPGSDRPARGARIRPDSATPRGEATDSALAGARADSGRSRQRAGDTVRAIHPLASDRDRYYRFSGGDTVATLHSHGRAIPIMRVHVEPLFDSVTRKQRIGAFQGELDFDATRHQIVRMRGQFVTTEAVRRGNAPLISRVPGFVAVAFVELVNAEAGGRYWLPSFQRSEFQASFAPLGPSRSIFRLISRFGDLRLETRSDSAASLVPAVTLGNVLGDTAAGSDSTLKFRTRLTFAPSDSVSRFGSWMQPLGDATARVTSGDFDDLAPDAWRTDGPPRLELMPTKFDEMARYDRIEGVYTGAAATLRFRDAAPGLTAHVFGGWAWKEETPRGGASLSLQRGPWRTTARVERALASTADFTPPFQGGIGLGTLITSVDDQDYVDRRLATISISRALRSADVALLTTEVGVADDRSELARLAHGIFNAGAPFRFNRGSVDGRYARGAALVELHPGVTGIFLEPGVGGALSYEIGRGDLNWQRTGVALAARGGWRDVVVAGRAEAGLLLGSHPPPQALFELGGEDALPGYAYKEFAGDRAASAGLLAAYPFPIFRRPWRAIRTFMIPGLSPGIAAGIQGGWAEASGEGARDAISLLDPAVTTPCDARQLSTCAPPVSRPTDGIRASVDARVTFFGGLLGFGVARPVDHAARWRFTFRVGQEF